MELRLPWKLKLSYGVGHVLNDLCASMWFSYMLLYMHKVAAFNNVNAGFLVLAGQIADALATPFVGYQSDRTTNVKYGRRKIWHLVGVVCVALSFPFIFSLCVGDCADARQFALMIYYVPFIVIFQFGWASTQISHLSMIPEITACEQGKVVLNAIRYFFTIASNLVVFVVCFVLFEVGVGKSDADQFLCRADAPKFQILAICVVALGLLFMLVFHCCVKENFCEDYAHEYSEAKNLVGSSSHTNNNKQNTIGVWFKTPLFYQVGFLYMMTRMIVNISQVYISYFVLDTLKLPKSAIAIAPAIIYTSGIFASFIAKMLNQKFGLKLTYFFGSLFIMGSSAWFYLLEDLTQHDRYEVYGGTVLLGIGGSSMLIVSLAMISEMIGKNTETSAFVYGSMSFLDKLSNGAAVMIIQVLHPCKNDPICCLSCQRYYRDVMSIVPGACAVLGALCLLTLVSSTFGSCKKAAVMVDDTSRENSVSSYGSIIENINRPLST